MTFRFVLVNARHEVELASELRVGDALLEFDTVRSGGHHRAPAAKRLSPGPSIRHIRMRRHFDIF